MLISLITFLVLISYSASYRTRIGLPHSPRYSSWLQCAANQDASGTKKVKLNFQQTFLVEKFLETYGGSSAPIEAAPIVGVFAIKSADGSTAVVKSSADVVSDISALRQEMGEDAVRAMNIQTFSKYDEETLEAYRAEIIKLLQPQIATVDSEDDGTGSGADQVAESSSAMSALEQLVKSQSAASSSNEGSVDGSQSDEPARSFPILSSDSLEFTVDNVHKVLDEIRPYLISDGGNVAVVSVDPEDRSVKLLLEGACGSCPSSTTTMKMGIERVLKENFPNLGSVEAVNPMGIEGASSLTLEKVEAALSSVLPAVRKMGGDVQVLDVQASSGQVNLAFTGPARLRQGVELVVKDVPDVQSVVFEDPATS